MGTITENYHGPVFAVESEELVHATLPVVPKATTPVPLAGTEYNDLGKVTYSPDPEHPSNWKNRRRLAYISMISILAATAVLFGPWIPESRLIILSEVVTWFYFSMTTIIGAYIGFASIRFPHRNVK